MGYFVTVRSLEKDLDETISMLIELRNADYGFDRNPDNFFKSVEKRAQAVINKFEPFYEKQSKKSFKSIKFTDDMNRLINKYNRMLDLCEPR